MARGHRGLGAFVAVVALIVGACTGTTPTPTPTPTTGPAVSTPSPVPSILALATQTPEPTAAPTETPAPTPAPKPTPKQVPATGWTTPHQVGSVSGCGAISVGIDAASRYHVAAECGGTISYFVSNGQGTWTTTVFSHPADRQDLGPQIAFRGNVVYVGYTQIAPDGGCGGGAGPSVGVYFRSRTQPNGAWSDPVRIGSADDNLQGFRVNGTTIHATVASGYYETLNGSTYHRYRIPGAIGRTSLRIGSDGRARIAYEAALGIRYAVFTGSGFTTTRIAGSTAGDIAPVLVLDGNDRPHLLWTRTSPAACGPSPDGTYYATNASGVWMAHRVTRDAGDTSLQIDDATGRVHVLVSADPGLKYLTATSSGPWTGVTIARTDWAASPVLRLDPATGTLLAVYIDGSTSGSARIYALIKP